MKILFIINPNSGATSNDEAILLIHKMAASGGTDFKFFYTSSENNDPLIQRQLVNYNPDRVIACGGDGTVQLVARNLMAKKKLPMGILPLGSANGLATALDLPSDLEAAVNIVFNSTREIPLDLLEINKKHICTHLADIGINARMIKNYEEKGEKGMLGYAKFLIPSIKESQLFSYTIKTHDMLYKKEGHMIVIGNANMYGTGIRFSDGSVSDGKFEIRNIPEIALDAAIKAGLTKFNVYIDAEMFSDVVSCSYAEIDINQKVDFQIDGEYMGEVDHLEIGIHPSAVSVLVKP